MEEMNKWEVFEKLLNSHDWTYMYSDDHSVWRRGIASSDKIEGMKKMLAAEDSVRAKALYDKYAVRGA
jgi:hypothetical protein